MNGSLWRQLEENAPPRELANVQELTRYASGLLETVRDTFPTYTLHNHVHAENVLRLMEELIGDRMDRVSGLEAAMLILSAYFHDIGMAYLPSELDEITRSRKFDDFLTEHPKYYLRALQDRNDIEIIEAFCRSKHAERAAVHIARIEPDLLTWGSASFARHLALLCESHDRPNSFVKNAPEFDDLLFGTCDLTFCALILRSADLLDFDNSRSPEPVYKYLGLAEKRTPREAVSDVEWLKHLKSDGFGFPPVRTERYALTFRAGPDNPAVEHDVRNFLDVIETELDLNQRMVRFCERWSDFSFPNEIGRAGIVSNGYEFGDYKFSLDRSSILDLFMGENLYPKPTVFLRELLQNSIDAVRARSALEGVDPASAMYSITVTDWTDGDGYRWIRIDDAGSGMDLSIVENYLLRIGKSYYSSPEFKAELARSVASGSQPIASIGRFGVGLLSSFMVADKIELSSRRVAPSGEVDKAIRISFGDLFEYFTVQSEGRQTIAQTMPARHGSDPGYRSDKDPGTSIALRLRPTRALSALDVAKLTKRFLLASRVPVVVNGKRIGAGHRKASKVISRRRLKSVMTSKGELDLSAAAREAVENIKVTAVPLMFGDLPSRPEIDGAGYLLVVNTRAIAKALEGVADEDLPGMRGVTASDLTAEDLAPLRRSPKAEFDILDRDHLGVQLRFESAAIPESADAARKAALRRLRSNLRTSEHGHHVVFDVLELAGQLDWPLRRPGRGSLELALSSWSHNGVRLPTHWTGHHEWAESSDSRRFIALVIASVWLEDELRPDLNVARAKVRNVGAHLQSALELSLRRALARAGTRHARRLLKESLGTSILEERDWRRHQPFEPTLGELATDPLVADVRGWRDEALFIDDASGKLVSANTLIALLAREPGTPRSVKRPKSPYLTDDFYKAMFWTLLDCHFDWRLDAKSRVWIDSPAKPGDLDQRLLGYAAGSFPRYGSASALLRCNGYKAQGFNREHPFTDWLLTIGPRLTADFPLYDPVNLHRDAARRARRSTNGGARLSLEPLRTSVSELSRFLGRDAMYAGSLDDDLIEELR